MVVQKSKPLSNYQKIVLNRIKACQILDFFVKLKYQTITIILSVSIKYSARDLLSDLKNYD